MSEIDCGYCRKEFNGLCGVTEAALNYLYEDNGKIPDILIECAKNQVCISQQLGRDILERIAAEKKRI